jgi:hypothetical protein
MWNAPEPNAAHCFQHMLTARDHKLPLKCIEFWKLQLSGSMGCSSVQHPMLCLQLKDYVEKVLQLEADKDALQLQLESLRHQHQQQQQQQQDTRQHAVQKASRLGPTTSSSSSEDNSEAGLAKEQELFELRLQKEQAVAAAARLKQQLLDLFGPDADRPSGFQATLEAAAGLVSSSGGSSRTLDIGTGADIGGSNSSSRLGSAGGGIDAAPTHSSSHSGLNSSASGVALGGTNRMRRSAAGSASGSGANSAAGKLSGREAELLTTVANLKAALERAMACSTPNTRFMQVGTSRECLVTKPAVSS